MALAFVCVECHRSMPQIIQRISVVCKPNGIATFLNIDFNFIVVTVKKAIPTSEVKQKAVCKAVIVRTAAPIRREDGSVVRFDNNAVVLLDKELNPVGTRVFGPVARELRSRSFMKIVSLAPEVV